MRIEVQQNRRDRMRQFNPMFDLEVAKRVGDRLRGQPRPFTEEHLRNLRAAKSANPTRLFGEDNPNWRGGIPSSGRWISSLERDIVKDLLIDRDGQICQHLGCEATTSLVLHHKDYDISNDDLSNLVLLCRSCNSSVNHGRYSLHLKSGEVCSVPVGLQNGLAVVEVEEVEKEVEVYNLRCEPYSNFFIDGLLCHNCDTAYAWDGNEGRDMEVFQIVDKCVELRPQTYRAWVCITGGEPLAQPEELLALVKKLKQYGFRVEVETNGSIKRPLWWTRVDSWVVDVKGPSSGVCGVSLDDWFGMRIDDQIKFVVGNQEDLDFARKMINSKVAYNPVVLVSPVIHNLMNFREGQEIVPTYYKWQTEQEWMQGVAEFCIEMGVRYSLQIHKILWGNKKGV